MVTLAWLLSIWLAFSLGYGVKDIRKRVESLEENIKQKIDKPKDEPESELIDPLDEVKEAQYQQQQEMKRLNGIK